MEEIPYHDAAPVLGRVVRSPGAGGKVFVVNPARVTNDEAEGSDLTFEYDSGIEVYVTILSDPGPGVGDLIVGVPVGPGFAARGGAACGKVCVSVTQECIIPGVDSYAPFVSGEPITLESGSVAAGFVPVPGAACVTDGHVLAISPSNSGIYDTIPDIVVEGGSARPAVVSATMAPVDAPNPLRLFWGTYPPSAGLKVGDVVEAQGGAGGPPFAYYVSQNAGGFANLNPYRNGSYTQLPTNPVAFANARVGGPPIPSMDLSWGVGGVEVTDGGGGYAEKPTARVVQAPTSGSRPTLAVSWDVNCCLPIPHAGTYRVRATLDRYKDSQQIFTVSCPSNITSVSLALHLEDGFRCCTRCKPLSIHLMGTTGLGSFPMEWVGNQASWIGQQLTPCQVPVMTDDVDHLCWRTVPGYTWVFYYFTCYYDRINKVPGYTSSFAYYLVDCCTAYGSAYYPRQYPGVKPWPSDTPIPSGPGVFSPPMAQSVDSDPARASGAISPGCSDPLAAQFRFSGRVKASGAYCSPTGFETAPVPGDFLVTEV